MSTSTNPYDITFKPNEISPFFQVVRNRVDEYFQQNGYSKNANFPMVLKGIAIMVSYIGSYYLILSGQLQSWGLLIGIIALAVSFAGIGMAIMHDAIHNAYSSNPKINKLLSYTLNFLGGNAFLWRIEHQIHHVFTNVHEVDEDIYSGKIIRQSKFGIQTSLHKFQHIYMLLLIPFALIRWMFYKDFHKYYRYYRMGLLQKKSNTPLYELLILILTKVFYVSYLIIIPIILLPYLWWQVILGFILFKMIAGAIIGILFQISHNVEKTETFIVNKEQNIENDWGAHQLMTTANFGGNSKLLSWYASGVNYQIEHHLFPNIAHIHYAKIAPIVEKTALEFGLPYHYFPTFTSAFKSYLKKLKNLGR